MKKKKTLYEDLGVSKDASRTEIKKAFREQAFLHHPDINPGMEEQFHRVSIAYKVLNNSKQREIYDETGEVSGIDNNKVIMMDKLCCLLLTILDKNSIEDLFKIDLVEVMRSALDKGITQMKKDIKKHIKKKEDVSRLASKFETVNDTPNFFKNLLEEQVEGYRRIVFNIEKELKSCKAQKEILNDVRFSREVEKMVISQYNMNSLGGFSTGSTATW